MGPGQGPAGVFSPFDLFSSMSGGAAILRAMAAAVEVAGPGRPSPRSARHSPAISVAAFPGLPISPAEPVKPSPNIPNTPSDEGNTVPQQPGDQPDALKPALESMTLLVAAVIVHDEAAGRVVLLQRSQNAKFAQGMWDLPVGKSEPGEPITQTAVRELHEETGLTVKPESLKVAHVIHGAWGVEAPGGFLTVVFAAHEWSGEPENREPHKHSQVRWVDTDAIPEEFVATTASALTHYLNGDQDVSLAGWQ